MIKKRVLVIQCKTTLIIQYPFRLNADEGLIMTNSNGHVVFYDRDMTKCFNNAAKWIDNRK